MKRCTKCGLEKNLSEFYQRKKHREGEYYERCSNCFKKRGKEYYRQNRERQLHLANLRKKKYREVRRLWLEKLKNKPCFDCGVKYPPYVMDFDHRVEGDKIGSISWLSLRNTSNLEKIKREIAKCDLVCSNCHRKRTYDRLQGRKNASVANVVKALV